MKAILANLMILDIRFWLRHRNGRVVLEIQEFTLVGVIITPEDVQFSPISIAAKDAGILVSQFDKLCCRKCWFVAFENGLLGLRTLTIIKDAIKLIKQRHGIEINTDEIPLDDKKPTNF